VAENTEKAVPTEIA